MSHSNTLGWRLRADDAKWRQQQLTVTMMQEWGDTHQLAAAGWAPTGSLSQVTKAAEPLHPRRQGHRVLCKHGLQVPPLNLQGCWSHLYNFWFLNLHNNNLLNDQPVETPFEGSTASTPSEELADDNSPHHTAHIFLYYIGSPLKAGVNESAVFSCVQVSLSVKKAAAAEFLCVGFLMTHAQRCLHASQYQRRQVCSQGQPCTAAIT